MWTKIKGNEIYIGGAIAALLYGTLAYLIDINSLIELLNGAFLGIMVCIFLLYWRTGVDALMGRGEYRREHRFAVGVALQWMAFMWLRLDSAVVRSGPENSWVRDSHWIAIPLVFAILAGMMQVLAPGFKHVGTKTQAFVHGQDRIALLAAVLIGLIVALVSIGFQRAG